MAAVDVDEHYLPKELEVRHLLNIDILEMASSLALSESAELNVVSAWQALNESYMQGGFMQFSDDEVSEYVENVRQIFKGKLDLLMDQLQSKCGSEALNYLKPKKQLLKGKPRQKIPAYSKEIKADLLVMGTVGRTGISGLIMGNTAEAILNQVNCSVLAIKPEGFKTPIAIEDQY